MKKIIKVILFIALILGAIGTWYFMDSYNKSEFTLGQAAYLESDYETAYEHLRNAIKWNYDSEGAIRMYAHSAYETGHYEVAEAQYEDLEELTETDTIRLHEVYMYITDQALDDGNKQLAVTTLNKDLDIIDSDYSAARLEAITGDGTAELENGDVIDSYGNVIQMLISEDDYVTMTYDDGQLISVSYGDYTYELEYAENVSYNITFKDDSYTIEKMTSDDDGNLTTLETITPEGSDIIRYTYYDNGNGRITSISEWHLSDDTSYTWNCQYKDGVLNAMNKTERGTSLGEYKTFAYDSDGNLTTIKEYENLTDIVSTTKYEYKYNVVVQETYITDEIETRTYELDGSIQHDMTITNTDDEVVGQGTKIDNNWIIVYY